MPPAPRQRDITSLEDTASYIHDLQSWINAVQFYQNDLYNILHNGYLVRTWRIEELTADLITAGTITTEELYIYDNHFQLNGATGRIVVTDDNDTQRLVIGKFGAGTAYGIKGYKDDGTLLFNISDTISLDGALITNATIAGAKLVNSTVGTTKLEDLAITTGKLANSAVTNSKIDSLSASKITLSGTLTCTSTTTAINITSSGVITLSNGGDIVFKATASDTSFISFRNSSNSERGSIAYNPTSNIFSINNANGADLYIDATFGTGGGLVARAEEDATLESTTASAFIKGSVAQIQVATNITLSPSTVVQVNGNMRGDTNNTRDLGTPSIKYANMWTVVDHVGDIEFDNGWRLTEPDKVYDGAEPGSGLLVMDNNWNVVGAFDKMGNLYIKGFVKRFYDFLPPNVARRESKNEEEINERRNHSLN